MNKEEMIDAITDDFVTVVASEEMVEIFKESPFEILEDNT